MLQLLRCTSQLSRQSGQGLLKLDSKNAFNKVRRNTMLQLCWKNCLSCTRSITPVSFLHLYSILVSMSACVLFKGGFQQSDPICPLLFCATSLKLACCMTSECNIYSKCKRICKCQCTCIAHFLLRACRGAQIMLRADM